MGLACQNVLIKNQNPTVRLFNSFKAILGVRVENSLGLIKGKFRRIQLFSCIYHICKANAS